LGVITLNPEATSMLSLFWVPVCVVLQLINSDVQATAALQSNIGVFNFIGLSLIVDVGSKKYVRK
jgi:hypothetical protein